MPRCCRATKVASAPYKIPLGCLSRYLNESIPDGTLFMSNYNYPFGHRHSWVHNIGGRMRKTNQQAVRRTNEDSIISEQAQREANRQAKPKFTTQQLVAMLPSCERTAKSVDDLVQETLTIIDLLDNTL
jgi:hypothetical protein